MITEKFANLRNTKKIEATTASDQKEININYFIKEMTELLKIDCPAIQSVACIFESDGLVQAQKEIIKNELPDDAQYQGAYYLDEQDIIFVSQKYPVSNSENLTLRFTNITDAENIFSIAHELRHVWQKKYHSNKYYKKNAINMEVIYDIAEIDADAFAISYVFSDRTPFTFKDMPHSLEEICLQATADEGKRWKRAYELVEEFSFKNTEKIEDAKQGVDYEAINKYISIMKDHIGACPHEKSRD